MKERIDELAKLMAEFKLAEAELTDDSFRVAFKKRRTAPKVETVTMVGSDAVAEVEDYDPEPASPPVDNKPAGIPITSPMTGIYYSAPSPGSPPFVTEGGMVTAGEVIGLIEAMKVFNEIPAPASGTVHKVMVESGQLVNVGDPLMYIG